MGHHQFIHTVIGEHCGDAQLLGDDDLLRHGRSGEDLQKAGQNERQEVALNAEPLSFEPPLASPMQGEERGSGA